MIAKPMKTLKLHYPVIQFLIIGDYTGWDFRMWLFGRVVGLTGFSYKSMHGRFCGTKKTGHNNKETIRWGSTVPVHFIMCVKGTS